MLTRRVLATALAVAAVGAGVAGCSSATPPPAPAPSSVSVAVGPPVTATTPPALPALAPTSGVRRVPPERQDEAFQAALARRKLTIADSPATTTQYGRIVCSHLDANEPLPQLLNEVQSTAQLDGDNAGYVLGAAAAVYCPDDLSKLPTG